MRKASALEIWVERLRAAYRALVRVRLPRIFGLVLRNPRDSMCAVALTLAVAAIVANALYLQPGRHPAPIFAIRTRPVMSDEPAATAAQLPRRRPAEADIQKPEPASKNDQVPLPRPRPDQTADVTNSPWHDQGQRGARRQHP